MIFIPKLLYLYIDPPRSSEKPPTTHFNFLFNPQWIASISLIYAMMFWWNAVNIWQRVKYLILPRHPLVFQSSLGIAMLYTNYWWDRDCSFQQSNRGEISNHWNWCWIVPQRVSSSHCRQSGSRNWKNLNLNWGQSLIFVVEICDQ